MKKTAAIIFLLFITAQAQRQSDSLDFNVPVLIENRLYTRFEKQLNTFYLTSLFHFDHLSEKYSIRINEGYNSTLIRASDKNIRDENSLTMRGIYNITDYLNAGLLAKNLILSDSRRIEINQASQSSAVLFTRYSPNSNYYISPFAGYTSNRQIGEIDNGMLYGIEGFAENVQLSDFFVTSELKFRNEDISPRKNLLRHFTITVFNYFSEDVVNNLNTGYSNQRRDFYFTADSVTSSAFNINNNIQSRTETGYYLQDRLAFNGLFKNTMVDLSGRVMWRNIDRDTRYKFISALPGPLRDPAGLFDTEIDELKLEFESNISYNTEGFSSLLRLNHSERDERHRTKRDERIDEVFYEQRSMQESMKNNISVRTSLSFLGDVVFSPSDRFYFSFYQNKLRYDTPADENYDDRDELLTIFRLRYIKQLSSFFEAFINTEGNISRTVYILSEKSSNNNINRVIRLSSGGYYSGKNFTSFNSFEVSANYTVYDFEDLNPAYKSYAFRQFTFVDSTTIPITNRLNISAESYIKVSEQGDFNWTSFTARPGRYLEEIYSEPKVNFIYKDFLFSAGLRYFALNTYNFQGKSKILDTRYTSIGPLTEFHYSIKNSLSIRIYGWYEFIRINNIGQNDQTNLILDMLWNL